ncbi:MAG: uracil-DNA glycosylase [Rhizobiales bacterium]|nr:uracil-DNA glycosylase [Hyphomicrobiales bacterium]
MNTPSPPTAEPPPTARELLAFYLEAGVDCALLEEPPNRLLDPEIATPPPVAAPTANIRRPPPAPAAIPRAPAATAPAPDVAIASARDAARTAPTLEALRALLETFDGCALKQTATRLVFADGNPQARIMFVGEAPGRDEDLEGIPFIGRSGKLLDRMIGAIGLDRTTAYITNVIPWRPPGNRDPSPQETQICLPFIKPSSHAVLELKDGIMRTRGRWHNYDTGTRTIRAMAMFHPAYLLRQPIHKRLAWQDLRAISKALDAATSAPAT